MKKETIVEVGLASAGAGLGAVIGASVGIAGFFGAAPATIPLAVLFGGIGWGCAKYKKLRDESAHIKAQIARAGLDATP